MGTRRQARECALQMLYQFELSRASINDVIVKFWIGSDADDETRIFANELVNGVVSRLNDLDTLLSTSSTNWKLTRMAAVDKNILRIAAYEISYCDNVPSKVAINEAVEIAKRFGTEDSGAFVNGILDNIAKAHPSEEDK